MITQKYIATIKDLIDRIFLQQEETLNQAAALIAGSLENGGVLHFFGSGHSHMLGEEIFYRAGGLVPVNSIFEPALMLHEGACKSTKLERLYGYAAVILDHQELQAGEVIIIASNSGINVVPVEMAMEAKKRGLKVLALTSLASSAELESRHSSGTKLYQEADLILDNGVKTGDAQFEVDGMVQKTGPVSTISGIVLLNLLMLKVIENLAGDGDTPPVFMSANIPGGSGHNKKIIEKYRGRLKSL